jgi:hypothetical protein
MAQRPIAIQTIGDLGERDQLYAYCEVCRHGRQLDLAEPRERYGPELSLKGLRARLRCSRCGAGGGQAFHVWDMGSPRPVLALAFLNACRARVSSGAIRFRVVS